MTASRYITCVLGLVGAILSCVATFNFVVDPLQYYRLAKFYPPAWSDNQRYQNPALARQAAYDTIVLGNSLSENFLVSHVQQRLGGRALNLAIAGSTIREQSMVLELALARGTLRHVIWVIDPNAFARHDEVVEDFGPFPWHLYKQGFSAASEYLLSSSTLISSISALRATDRRELNDLHAWHDQYTYGPDQVRKDWAAQVQRWTPELKSAWMKYAPTWEQIPAVVERRLIAHIRANPGVRIDLIFPPMTLLGYAASPLNHDENLAQRLLLAEYIDQAVAPLANATVWDFRGESSSRADYAHFKDLSHYDLAVIDTMLDTLARGEPRPLVSTRILADQILGELHLLCDSGGADDSRCPPTVRCERDKLQSWSTANVETYRLLTYARGACNDGAYSRDE